MSDNRTATQREANELDLQMFNLMLRLDGFRDRVNRPSERVALQEAVTAIRTRRHHVQAYMHPKDREKLDA